MVNQPDIQLHSDHAVIKKILNGSIELFEILIRRYNSVLYKIARSYGFNHQDAEDLMQDTHVSAYTSLQKLKVVHPIKRGSQRSWSIDVFTS